MGRFSRQALFGVARLQGSAPFDFVVAELRAIPRALARRQDEVLRRGRGPRFVLTRWKMARGYALVARVQVTVEATEAGTSVDAKVTPSPAHAVVLFTPLIPLVAIPFPVITPGEHIRLLLLGMAAFVAALFWGLAWSNVPEYTKDRAEILALVQSILDGEPLESSRRAVANDE